jgi:hypothetical protein
MTAERDWAGLREVLAADLLAPTATVQSRTGYAPAVIELMRSQLAQVAITAVEVEVEAEAGGKKPELQPTPALRQIVPQLKRLVRELRYISPDFDQALINAIGGIKHTGLGSDPEPLANYIACQPLTMDEQQLLAELLRLLPVVKPRGVRGERKTPRQETAEAEYRAAGRVHARLQTLRQQSAKKRVVPGTTDRVIDEDMTAEPPADPAHHKARIKALLRNPSRLK